MRQSSVAHHAAASAIQEQVGNDFSTPKTKAIEPLTHKELPIVKEYEKTLLWKVNNKRTGIKKEEDKD